MDDAELTDGVSAGILETKGSLERTSRLGFENKNELLEFIRGKVVLDLGSGEGGFAHKAYKELGDETKIISVNKRLVNPRRRSNIDWKNKSTTLSADWNNLPFAEKSFDVIFSTGAYLYYEGTFSVGSWNRILDLLRDNNSEVRISLSPTSNKAGDVDQAIDIALSRGFQANTYEKDYSCSNGVDSYTSKFSYLIIKHG